MMASKMKRLRLDEDGDADDTEAFQPPFGSWDTWSVDEVAKCLLKEGIPGDVVQKFKVHKISGKVLKMITDDDLDKHLEIKEPGMLQRVRCFLNNVVFEGLNGMKVINDPVHGLMQFHPLCMAIINSPQFQRLRDIKQMGPVCYVYPGASHTRFEHSLGVCNLAGKLVIVLQNRQPYLGITDEDALCVQIAGLCHDLGHGPFSHLFDRKFIPFMKKLKGDTQKWKHEIGSVRMFDYMVKTNKLEPVFERYGITSHHRDFIKEMIIGQSLSDNGEGKRFYGPGSKKSFLYEIVANQRNGVDVDKWDYYRRDCHHLGMGNAFEYFRLFHFCRVIEVDNELQICVRDKEAFNVYEMFHMRYTLHRFACQHKVVLALDFMIGEALKEAELSGCVKIPGDDGKEYNISECTDHMDAFTNLTDNILQLIKLTGALEGPGNVHLKRAQEIVDSIERRQLYKCIRQSLPITVPCPDDDDIRQQILDKLSVEDIKRLKLEETSRFMVQTARLNFGKGKENPVNDMRFFSKGSQDKAVPVKASEVSCLLPQNLFKEELVRMYLYPSDDHQADEECFELLTEAFQHWCTEHCASAENEVPPADMKHEKSTDFQSSGYMTPDCCLTAISQPEAPVKARHRLTTSI